MAPRLCRTKLGIVLYVDLSGLVYREMKRDSMVVILDEVRYWRGWEASAGPPSAVRALSPEFGSGWIIRGQAESDVYLEEVK